MGCNSIFLAIAEQLNINKYHGESNTQYHARIVYSALSFWARLIVATETLENGELSKAALHRKISSILQNFLSVDPNLSEWFFPEASSSPENLIRDTPLRSGDFLESDYDSHLAISSPRKYAINSTTAIQLGYVPISNVLFSSGLACVTHASGQENASDLLEEFSIPKETSADRINHALQKARWEKVDSVDFYEIFDVNRTSVFSSCWTRFLPLKDSQIYVARRQFSFGVFEYCMLQRKNNDYYIAVASSYSQHESIRETQRLLYATKAIYGMRAAASVDHYSQYSIWHFWSKLPPAENALMRYIACPLENINNPKNEFIVRKEFDYVVEAIAHNLDLEIEVTNY